MNIHEILAKTIHYGKQIYKPLASHPNPCGVCHKNVNKNQRSFKCSMCNLSIHYKCNKKPSPNFKCETCNILYLAEIFPFGLIDNHTLTDLIDTNLNSNNLDNLPSYDINSKVNSFGNLKDTDIDENLPSNINSKYYSCSEFENLNKRKAFNIVHSNLNGLESKFDDYTNFINSNSNLDVLCISETSQKENCDFKLNVTINGYKQPYCIGSKTSRGGVAIYVKDNLNVLLRSDLSKNTLSFEAVWIEIIQKNKNIICGCIYRHPNSDINQFLEYFEKALSKVTKENKECYISGDFNINLLNYDQNKISTDFLDLMSSAAFLPSILEPTRITESSSTLIDNIFTNNIKQSSLSGNILISFADHLTQFISVHKTIVKNKPKNVQKRDFLSFNNQSFKDDVSIQTWNSLTINDTDKKFDDFLWRFEACVNRHAPLKNVTLKQNNKKNKPWFTHYILRLIRYRDKLFHKKKLDPLNGTLKRTYILFRNRVTREIRKSKKVYYKNFFNNNICNIKKTWQGIKEIINVNKPKASDIPYLKYKNKKIDSKPEMANAFNDFFTNVGPNLDKDIPRVKKPNCEKLYLKSRVLQSFLISPTDQNEVIEIIDSLDESKSTSSHSIPIKLIKIAKHEILIPLVDICNSSFSQGCFPSKNKLAEVIPIHKDGPTEDVTNYRPISLLPAFSKIMEKLMAKRLSTFLELHSILFPKQFGFRSGYSTTHSLIDIVETIRHSLDNKKFGCGLFIDLKKAFDTVNHDILLTKLEHYGIRDISLQWFKSYLTDRKQYVSIDGTHSSVRDITCGVPQGSVLGPILFLLYINDLPNISKKLKFFLFADDTNIYFDSDNLKKLECIMNKELKKLREWLCINRLSLNISKTKFILFCPKNKPKFPINITINKKPVGETDSIKYLGILLDSNLNFKKHTAELNKKISRALGILYKIRHCVPTSVLLNLYYATIYPFLLYGIEVWGNTCKTFLQPLLITQKKFVRMATYNDKFDINLGRYPHSKPLFHDLNILELHDIFSVQVAVIVYDHEKGSKPTTDIIKFTRSNSIHSYPTRYSNSNNFNRPRCNTTQYGLKNLITEGSKLWTWIPSVIKSLPSKKLFKKKLKKYLINLQIVP